MPKVSRGFGAQKAVKAHLVRPGATGGISAEVADLRGDVERGFKNLEAATSYPLISFMDGNADISAGTPAARTLVGTDFLQGQVQAALTTGTGTSLLTFTAVKPGTGGNGIRISLLDTGTVTVTVTANDIDVTYDGPATSSAATIASAVNGDADAQLLVNVTTSGGGGGTAIVPIATLTNLVGGLGEGFSVQLAGLEQDVTDVSDTQVIFNSANPGTVLANGDLAALVVISDDVRSNELSVPIIT